MATTEDRNCNCPACELMLPPEAESCPNCGMRFCPAKRNFLNWYYRSWQLWRCTTGRATPQEFYAFFIPTTILFLWWCKEIERLTLPDADPLSYLFVGLLGLYHLLAIVPFCSLITRRLHDRDLYWHDLPEEIKVAVENYCDASVWTYLSILEPALWLAFAVFVPLKELFSDTVPGPNRFGPSIRYPRYNSHLD